MELSEERSRDDTRRARRRVRFANRTRIYLIPCISEFKREEHAAIWMTDEDQKASQQGVVEDILRLRRTAAIESSSDHDHHDDTDESCGRGLEHMRSQSHMEQRRMNKEANLNGVLDVQDDHFDAGVFNDHEIAEVSISTSEWARQRALSVAASDAAYVWHHVRIDEEVQDLLRRTEQYANDNSQNVQRNNEDTTTEEVSVNELALRGDAMQLVEEEEDPHHTGPSTATSEQSRDVP